MVPQIGRKVFYNGNLYHVQDRDCVNGMAKIAIPDINSLCFYGFWVSWSDLQDADHFIKCPYCNEMVYKDDTFFVDSTNEHVCEDCYNENFSDCARCGETMFNEDMIWIDSTNEHVCEDCYNNHYFRCNDCNESFDENSAYHTPNGMVCQTCFTENWSVCNGCGNVISNDEAYFTESGDGPYCEYCENCYNSDDCDDCDDCDGLISGYSYKPTPVFHTIENQKTNLFFGFELEIECQSRNRSKNAEDISNIFDNYCYYKSDGSLNYGFEIVSHPMTWDFITSNRFQKRLKDLEAYCKDNGIKSHDTTTCGFHIHASKKHFSTLHIFKLLSFVFNKENFYPLLLPVSQRKEENLNRWSTINDTYQTSFQKAKDKRSDNRYTALNLTRDTIEARFFRGTIRKDRIMKNLEFYKALIDYTELSPLKNADSKNCFLSFVQKNKKQYANLDSFFSDKNLY